MSRSGRPEYEDRIVLFLDVLGWRELIEASTAGLPPVEWIVQVLDRAPHWADLISGGQAQGKEDPLGMEVAHFSDTIVFSCRDTPSSVPVIFGVAGDLAYDFLAGGALGLGRKLKPRGLLSRGAIVRGQLYQHGNVLFGPALVQAYSMESSLAVYPRILIPDDLVATLNESEECGKWVRRDSDGLYFADTLSPELMSAKGPGQLNFASLRLGKVRESIEGGLLEHGSDLRKRAKWMWLLNYFNNIVAEFSQLVIPPAPSGLLRPDPGLTGVSLRHSHLNTSPINMIPVSDRHHSIRSRCGVGDDMLVRRAPEVRVPTACPGRG